MTDRTSMGTSVMRLTKMQVEYNKKAILSTDYKTKIDLESCYTNSIMTKY